MEKKKYEVKIADVDMSIISDEREDFVQRLVTELDDQISAITLQSKRCSKLDAAILVALDYASGKAKAEKRVRNLEAQIALYDANLRRMRDDNIKLKNALLEGRELPIDELRDTDEPSQLQFTDDDDAENNAAEQTEAKSADEAPAEAEKAADSASPAAEADGDGASRDDKIRQIADLFHRTAPDATQDDPQKDAKLRQIESLLRSRNDD